MAYAAMSEQGEMWDDGEMEDVLVETVEPEVPSASAAASRAVRRPRSPGPIGGRRPVKSARVGDTWKQTIQFLSSMFFWFSNSIFLKGYVLRFFALHVLCHDMSFLFIISVYMFYYFLYKCIYIYVLYI